MLAHAKQRFTASSSQMTHHAMLNATWTPQAQACGHRLHVKLPESRCTAYSHAPRLIQNSNQPNAPRPVLLQRRRPSTRQCAFAVDPQPPQTRTHYTLSTTNPATTLTGVNHKALHRMHTRQPRAIHTSHGRWQSLQRVRNSSNPVATFKVK
jgi:hypothetical protein